MPLLKRPEHAIRRECKSKSKLKADITTELWIAYFLSNRADEPIDYKFRLDIIVLI